MVFIDGENLAIRYKNILKDRTVPKDVAYKENLYVWSHQLDNLVESYTVIRKYYYTSVQGASPKIESIIDELKALGIEVPRVFKKEKGRSTKRVDISLATDMLTQAHRKNFDIAVLVAGDEDYVPLVESIMAEGCRVWLWFFNEGLSAALQRTADYYRDITKILLGEERLSLGTVTFK